MHLSSAYINELPAISETYKIIHSMNEGNLIIGFTVGYMLKVMKSQKNISKFKAEFASIRHGNYYDFIGLVKGQIPEMVVYGKRGIEVNPESRKDDIDFIALFKAGPSLNIFYKKCHQEYGSLKDNDVPNSIFYEVALFEISLRMHANNNELLDDTDTFENVINKLCSFKGMSVEETEIIQKGRKFVNMIKHRKMHFDTWEDGISAFKRAYLLKNRYHLKIV